MWSVLSKGEAKVTFFFIKAIMEVHKKRQGHVMGHCAVGGHLTEANYIKF